MEIHKMGGGIGFTVEHTKRSSNEELLQLLIPRLDRMLSFGTTTLEAKSGYGLNAETEMRLLQVLHECKRLHPMEIVSTFLGAHSIPKGLTAPIYAKDIIENQIPMMKLLREQGKISARNIDVFCEKGVFEVEDSRRILQAGKEAGLLINFHGDELNPMGSAILGAEIEATAISHLEKIDDIGIHAMSKKPIVAVLLPNTAYVLRLEYPPARKLIENQVPVALGSDFNPNAHCLSMPYVMNLACVMMKMTMNESLVASTLNSAASLDISSTHGSIEVGKVADFVLLNHPIWEHLIYEMVDPPIELVIKKGVVVFENNKLSNMRTSVKCL